MLRMERGMSWECWMSSFMGEPWIGWKSWKRSLMLRVGRLLHCSGGLWLLISCILNGAHSMMKRTMVRLVLIIIIIVIVVIIIVIIIIIVLIIVLLIIVILKVIIIIVRMSVVMLSPWISVMSIPSMDSICGESIHSGRGRECSVITHTSIL